MSVSRNQQGERLVLEKHRSRQAGLKEFALTLKNRDLMILDMCIYIPASLAEAEVH